jgi:hypothetical protein
MTLVRAAVLDERALAFMSVSACLTPGDRSDPCESFSRP